MSSVLYNGACPVCAAGIDAISDGEDVYIDIAADPSQLASLGLTARDVQYRLHAVTKDGELLRGIDAVALSLQGHPRWAWAGRLMALPGLRQVGWLGYEVIAFALFRWNRSRGNF